MTEYNTLTVKELRQIAQDRGYINLNYLKKADLISLLEDEPDPDSLEIFKFIPEENRWVKDIVKPHPISIYNRVFDQKAVLHTSEEHSTHITRAYNLEPLIPINDTELKIGAELRGQELGEASGGRFLKDKSAEV